MYPGKTTDGLYVGVVFTGFDDCASGEMVYFIAEGGAHWSCSSGGATCWKSWFEVIGDTPINVDSRNDLFDKLSQGVEHNTDNQGDPLLLTIDRKTFV